MGSKTFLLSNGLGELLLNETPKFERFVDPFCGSGAVAEFVAVNTRTKVTASDLQAFAVALARATVGRDQAANSNQVLNNWLDKALEKRDRNPKWKKALQWKAGLDNTTGFTKNRVIKARALCRQPSQIGPTWNAYGGYYFSPDQSLTFDYLRKYLPRGTIDRSIAISSLIRAASRCAASPGHTAQPFGVSEGGLRAIEDAWTRDIESLVKKYVEETSAIHAQTRGDARKMSAAHQATKATDADLFFIDPPYSAVQYSRFYHVLETLTVGKRVEVTGAGRYPPLAQRASSQFSTKKAGKALDGLLKVLSGKNASVVLTFPDGQASNGLSGGSALQISRRYFNVRTKKIANRFSTLGGSANGRASRVDTKELILYLSPK